MLSFFTRKQLTNRTQINHNQIIIATPIGGSISEETSEWAGFVQTMKKFVRKHISVTNSNIDQIEQRIGSLNNRFDSEFDEII